MAPFTASENPVRAILYGVAACADQADHEYRFSLITLPLLNMSAFGQ